jgi:hypothetical protein
MSANFPSDANRISTSSITTSIQDAMLTIQVRLQSGHKIPIEVDTSAKPTIADLRSLVSAASGLPDSRQRLVYAGRVLPSSAEGAEEIPASTLGLKENGTLYVVEAKEPDVPPPTSESLPRPKETRSPVGGLMDGPAMQVWPSQSYISPRYSLDKEINWLDDCLLRDIFST